MDYQQAKTQQKTQSSEQMHASVPLSQPAVKGSESPVKSGAQTGNFILDLTAAVDDYVSGKTSADAIDQTIAEMPKIDVPEVKERKGLAKFFYNLFHGKQAKADAAAAEQAQQQIAEQDKQRAELEAQKGTFNEAMGNALSQFTALMDAATTENKKDLIANQTILYKIMNNMPEANVKSTMDSVFPAIDEGHMELLMDMIEARFGVPVMDGSDKRLSKLPEKIKDWYVVNTKILVYPDGHEEEVTERPIPWTFTALQRVYEIYLMLPAEHLKKVVCLSHYDDTNYGGAAYGSAGVYYVNYAKGNENKVEQYKSWYNGQAVGHIDSANDMRNGTKMLDMTIAHELGHIVDGTHNYYGYSDSASFRKWSEWYEIKNSATDDIISYMSDSLTNGPFDKELTDNELALVKEIGKKIIAEAPYDWAAVQTLIKTQVKGAEKIPEASKEALIEKLTDNSIDSNVLYHIWSGLGNNLACYNYRDVMRGMKRPFWQGYSGQSWFSFNKEKWSNKISCYQYRCPKEEFAETYASYHTAPTAEPHEVEGKNGKKEMVPYKKGEKTPEGLRTWFEKEGLHRMEPENVEGSADVIKEDAKKAS